MRISTGLFSHLNIKSSVVEQFDSPHKLLQSICNSYIIQNQTNPALQKLCAAANTILTNLCKETKDAKAIDIDQSIVLALQLALGNIDSHSLPKADFFILYLQLFFVYYPQYIEALSLNDNLKTNLQPEPFKLGDYITIPRLLNAAPSLESLIAYPVLQYALQYVGEETPTTVEYISKMFFKLWRYPGGANMLIQYMQACPGDTKEIAIEIIYQMVLKFERTDFRNPYFTHFISAFLPLLRSEQQSAIIDLVIKKQFDQQILQKIAETLTKIKPRIIDNIIDELLIELRNYEHRKFYEFKTIVTLVALTPHKINDVIKAMLDCLANIDNPQIHEEILIGVANLTVLDNRKIDTTLAAIFEPSPNIPKEFQVELNINLCQALRIMSGAIIRNQYEIAKIKDFLKDCLKSNERVSKAAVIASIHLLEFFSKDERSVLLPYCLADVSDLDPFYFFELFKNIPQETQAKYQEWFMAVIQLYLEKDKIDFISLMKNLNFFLERLPEKLNELIFYKINKLLEINSNLKIEDKIILWSFAAKLFLNLARESNILKLQSILVNKKSGSSLNYTVKAFQDFKENPHKIFDLFCVNLKLISDPKIDLVEFPRCDSMLECLIQAIPVEFKKEAAELLLSLLNNERREIRAIAYNCFSYLHQEIEPKTKKNLILLLTEALNNDSENYKDIFSFLIELEPEMEEDERTKFLSNSLIPLRSSRSLPLNLDILLRNIHRTHSDYITQIIKLVLPTCFKYNYHFTISCFNGVIDASQASLLADEALSHFLADGWNRAIGKAFQLSVPFICDIKKIEDIITYSSENLELNTADEILPILSQLAITKKIPIHRTMRIIADILAFALDKSNQKMQKPAMDCIIDIVINTKPTCRLALIHALLPKVNNTWVGVPLLMEITRRINDKNVQHSDHLKSEQLKKEIKQILKDLIKAPSSIVEDYCWPTLT